MSCESAHKPVNKMSLSLLSLEVSTIHFCYVSHKEKLAFNLALILQFPARLISNLSHMFAQHQHSLLSEVGAKRLFTITLKNLFRY